MAAADHPMTLDPSPLSSGVISLAVHELRTPLGVASGYLRLLERGHAGPLTEAQQRLVADAERSCHRASELVNQLSEIARLAAEPPVVAGQALDLAVVLAQAIDGQKLPGDRFAVERPPEPLVVEADPVRLATIVDVLLTVVQREQPTRQPLPVVCGGDERVAWLDIGSPEEPPAGEPRRVSQERGGLGLDLALAVVWTRAHGGDLFDLGSGRPCGLRLSLPRLPHPPSVSRPAGV